MVMLGRVSQIALRLARIAVGFALASLAAGLTLVLFVYAPPDLEGLRSDLGGERLSEAGLFALIIAPHVAMAAALPALAGAIFAEVRKVAGWWFYALAGMATAAAGFLVQHLSEAPGEPSVLSGYALAAFLTSGLVGGLAYWALSGRFCKPKRGLAPPADAPPPAVAHSA
jgi:hypothetical protein